MKKRVLSNCTGVLCFPVPGQIVEDNKNAWIHPSPDSVHQSLFLQLTIQAQPASGDQQACSFGNHDLCLATAARQACTIHWALAEPASRRKYHLNVLGLRMHSQACFCPSSIFVRTTDRNQRQLVYKTVGDKASSAKGEVASWPRQALLVASFVARKLHFSPGEIVIPRQVL